MTKLLVIILGLLAFGLLCYLCINKHVPEFLAAASPPVANVVKATPAPSPAQPVAAEQQKTQVQVNDQIAGKTIEFDKGSDHLTPRGTAVLDGLVPIFQQHPNTNFEVGGHTDDSGNAAGNQQLSERRAAAVKKYLVGKGLTESHFTVKGYGQTQPIADNKTDEGRQKNRRIGFTVTGGGN